MAVTLDAKHREAKQIERSTMSGWECSHAVKFFLLLISS